VSGLASMVPGNADPELARIDVPVFIGVGANDITGDPFRIPPSFPNSRDVTLFVLDGAGHNHNAAADRERLWDRVAASARGLRPGDCYTSADDRDRQRSAVVPP